jgi:hypothetical protein
MTLFGFHAEISENIINDTTQHDSLNLNNLVCRNRIKQIQRKLQQAAETAFTVRFEVLTLASIKMAVFCVDAPCSLVNL